MAIPKIIHYCWFGGKEIPDEYSKYIEEWHKICPDYEIIRWDESNYDLTKNRFLREAVKQKKWAFVSDYARLDIINTYGGIYLDVDVQLLRNLDDLLQHKSFWGIEKNFDGNIFVNTGLGFGAEKNNHLVYSLRCLYNVYDNNNIDMDFTPCPIFQKKTFIDLGFFPKNKTQTVDGNLFLSSEFFSPKDPISQKIMLSPNTYSIHHYSMSWLDSNNKDYFIKFAKYSKILGPWWAERILVFKNKFRGK